MIPVKLVEPTLGEVTIGILETMWDKKKLGPIYFIEGKIYKLIRSTIALEIA